MTKSKEKTAIELFRAGMNCAQSVVMTYSDVFDFEREMAAGTSCGFRGGMGRLRKPAVQQQQLLW